MEIVVEDEGEKKSRGSGTVSKSTETEPASWLSVNV